jgi:hypothetical protein
MNHDAYNLYDRLTKYQKAFLRANKHMTSFLAHHISESSSTLRAAWNKSEAYLHRVRGHFLGSAYHACTGHKNHIQTAVRLYHVRFFALWDDTLVARQVPNKVEEQLKEIEIGQADRWRRWSLRRRGLW